MLNGFRRFFKLTLLRHCPAQQGIAMPAEAVNDLSDNANRRRAECIRCSLASHISKSSRRRNSVELRSSGGV